MMGCGCWIIIMIRFGHRVLGVSRSRVGLVNRNHYLISHKDQRFLRFVNFDTNYLSQIPYIFQPLEPIITAIKDSILWSNSFVSLPWWCVLAISALAVRFTIFPLILVQMKRFSKIGPISPVLVFLKEGWAHSTLPFFRKLTTSIKIYRDLCKQQNFRLSTIFVYNLAYYPLLISMIYGIRKLLACPQLSSATFLHISNFSDIDPYFILPTLTIALYYFNFQRYITPDNEKTIITKIRRVCQVFLILWYPFLCSWPAGIVLYMFFNAGISVLQSSVMRSRWFMEKMNQKIILYGSIMQSVEYDKGISEGIIQAIRKGEENFDSLAIKEVQLEKQTIHMLQQLDKQDDQPEEEHPQK